jgi:hypothetical protein
MSGVLSIPYKSMSSGTKFDESSVKNYTNDKSSRSLRAAEMYVAFSDRCAEIILERKRDLHLDGYVVSLVQHLFGEEFLRAAGLRRPVAHHDQSLGDTLAKWLAITPDEADEVELRYKGLWRCFRASSFPNGADQGARADLKEVNCSLLNIRPRSVTGGTLCDFRWYYLGKGRERDERRVFEGFVIPNVDRVEFLGRVTTRHKLLTLMVWRFTSNPELRDHARAASGVSLSLNTSGGPVGARMRAFFVEESDSLEAGEFETLKNRQLSEIGVKPIDAVGSLIPPDQLQNTVSYLAEYKPIVGFFPAQDLD